MSSPMEFGECLKSLLSSLGISMNRLAKSINVDPSLVNRWVNGKRVPAYNSNYIEVITEFLAQNVKNSLQSESIDKLFKSVNGYYDKTISLEEKIKSCLYESQGHSLNKKNKLTQYRKKNSIIPISSEHPDLPMPQLQTAAISLSSDDKIIFGTNSILASFHYLLNIAKNSANHKEKKIYFTYINDVYFDYMHSEFHHLKKTLTELLKNGWEIHCFVKLTDDVSRIIRFINFFKSLIGMGIIHFFYADDYDTEYIGKDYFIVSGIGAISCFSHHSKYNNAFYLRTPSATNILEDYFKFITTNHSHPLLKYYPPEKSFDFLSCLAQKEDSFGNRILYNDCFTVLTLPVNLYKKILIKNHLPAGEIEKALELYQKRLQAFKTNIIANQYHDLYRTQSITNLLKNHQLCLYDHNGIKSFSLDIEDIIEFLINLIHLLETYKNYHITFLPDQDDHLQADHIKINCVVKEREAVFIEVINSLNNQYSAKYSIEEPLMVHGFEIYFRNILEKLSPPLKNKAKEIAWLKRQIEILAVNLHGAIDNNKV